MKVWYMGLFLIMAVFAFGMFFAVPTLDNVFIDMTAAPQSTVDLFEAGFFGLFVFGIGMTIYIAAKAAGI